MPTGRKRVAYRKMAMGLIYLGIYVTQYGKFNYSKSLEPVFMSYSLVQR
jgi:lysophospholipid acyltransferase